MAGRPGCWCTSRFRHSAIEPSCVAYACTIAASLTPTRNVATLAVLADDDPNWRPSEYRRRLWGCSLRMTFPPAKLLDFAGREGELEASQNPFAKVVLAHLKTLQTRRSPGDRRAWKFRIARGLHECGFSPDDTQELLKLVDWLMALPDALQRDFREQLHAYEEGRTMPYVTSFGRLAMLDLIEAQLRAKFGEEGVTLLPEISTMDDAEKYKAIGETIATVASLDEVRRACAAAVGPLPRGKKGSNAKRGRSRT